MYLKPLLIAAGWNPGKGQVDIWSRNLKGLEVYQESLTPDQCLFLRMFDLRVANCHRFHGIINVQDWVQSEKFFDMKQLGPEIVTRGTSLREFKWVLIKQSAESPVAKTSHQLPTHGYLNRFDIATISLSHR